MTFWYLKRAYKRETDFLHSQIVIGQRKSVHLVARGKTNKPVVFSDPCEKQSNSRGMVLITEDKSDQE